MPKLNNRPPKYSRIGKYAVVYLYGKKHYLGDYGSPESHSAYARLVAESKINPDFHLQRGKSDTTVSEFAAVFLDHAKKTLGHPNYTHYRIVVTEFLLKFYGDTGYRKNPAFQALLCAQNVKDPTGIRTNPYIIVAGRSASGKDKGREIIKKIFTQLENTPAYKGDWYKPLKFFVEGVASEPALLRWLEANHGALLWLWDEMGKELATYSNDRNAFLAGIPTTLMRLYTSGDSIFIPHVQADTKNTIPPIQQPNLVLYGTAEKETSPIRESLPSIAVATSCLLV